MVVGELVEIGNYCNSVSMMDFSDWCRAVRSIRTRLMTEHGHSDPVALDLFMSALCAGVFAARFGFTDSLLTNSPRELLHKHLGILFPFAARACHVSSESASIPELSSEMFSAVDTHPELIGWAYQIWNEECRSASTWAVSHKHEAQAERLSVAAATQIFTEEYIADFLVARCHDLIKTTNPLYELADPACGTGHLLARALLLWSNEKGATDVQRVKMLERLHGCDIDSVAAELCRVVLLLRSVQGDRLLCAQAWDVLSCTISTLHTTEGTLRRDETADVLHRSYDCIVTNPPYLGRRKITQSLKQFLDLYYPSGSIDLCAAFMQRCVELLKPGGIAGFVTSDKWLRLKGYRAFRNGTAATRGIYQELTIDLIAELGDRAFRPQLDLHDGVGVVLTVGRRTSPPSGHVVRYLLCSELRDWRAKADYLKDKATQSECGCPIEQCALQADEDGSVFLQAGGAPASLVHAQKKVADCAHIAVGLQTNDDARFVKYHWQVAPDPSSWRVHAKGGGYARWYGLNRWVLDIRDSSSFSVGMSSGRPLEELFASDGWTYSWFANGALGLRRKESGWSFGRAASSGVYCEDPRVVAFLNSRVASLCARLKGGKIQLPEGVVRGIPVPDSLSAVDPRLVEAAVAVKREVVSADPTDYTFLPSAERSVYNRLALEAVLLMIEASLERQVMFSSQLSNGEVARLSRTIAAPVGFAGSVSLEGYDEFWCTIPSRWSYMRDLLVHEERLITNCDPSVFPCGVAACDVERLYFSRTAERDEGGRFPATGPLERLCRRLNLHPVAAFQCIVSASKESSSFRRKLEEGDVKIALLVLVLRMLGFSWWSDPSVDASVSSVSAGDIADAAYSAFPATNFDAALGVSLEGWVNKELLPWHEKLFYGAPIIAARGESSSKRFALVGQL